MLAVACDRAAERARARGLEREPRARRAVQHVGEVDGLERGRDGRRSPRERSGERFGRRAVLRILGERALVRERREHAPAHAPVPEAVLWRDDAHALVDLAVARGSSVARRSPASELGRGDARALVHLSHCRFFTFFAGVHLSHCRFFTFFAGLGDGSEHTA